MDYYFLKASDRDGAFYGPDIEYPQQRRASFIVNTLVVVVVVVVVVVREMPVALLRYPFP
jgi:hypothetical protein